MTNKLRSALSLLLVLALFGGMLSVPAEATDASKILSLTAY